MTHYLFCAFESGLCRLLIIYHLMYSTFREGMEAHSSFLALKIPWTEEPGGLQSVGSQRVHGVVRVRRDLVSKP